LTEKNSFRDEGSLFQILLTLYLTVLLPSSVSFLVDLGRKISKRTGELLKVQLLFQADKQYLLHQRGWSADNNNLTLFFA